MAFFGDDVDPMTYSRNCDSDDDEDAAARSAAERGGATFAWAAGIAADAVAEPALMVFAAHGPGARFLDAVYPHLAAAEPVATIRVPDEDIGGGASGMRVGEEEAPPKRDAPPATCTVCAGPGESAIGSLALVRVHDDVPHGDVGSLVAALFQRVRAKRVLVLDSLPGSQTVLVDAKTGRPEAASDAPGPVLRVLFTSYLPTEEVEGFRALEAPNLLRGPAAAALSHCQVGKVPAAAFVSMRGHHVDLDSLRALLPVADLARKWLSSVEGGAALAPDLGGGSAAAGAGASVAATSASTAVDERLRESAKAAQRSESRKLGLIYM